MKGVAIGDGNPILMYTVLHETLFIFNIGSALLWLWLRADFVFLWLCFLWFILCMVEYNPLHDSCNKIELSFKHLLTASISFHKFVLIVPLILNCIPFYVIQIFNGCVIFLHLWLYTNPVFVLILLNYIFLKISLSLNPCSLGSNLGITHPSWEPLVVLHRSSW